MAKFKPKKVKIHSHVLEQEIGKRIRLVGDHPHAGCSGIIVRIGETVFGKRPVLKFDEPHMGVTECYIMQAKHAAREFRGKPKK